MPRAGCWRGSAAEKRRGAARPDTDCWPQSLLRKLLVTTVNCLLIKASQELLKHLSARSPATQTGKLQSPANEPVPLLICT